MTEDEIRRHVLRQMESNIHLEEGNRILELSREGLMDYFDVIDVILGK